ncbi:MAG TPA: anhydro-N-acetylmuramic acid kinase [Bdellovibrionota bacterium]|nr:anhydro-N-acetylmuramic acid kinase [Bdellovibrionota bacterium]
MKSILAIGVMSGSSLDGGDAVLLRLTPIREGYRIRRLGHAHASYPPKWADAARAIAEEDSLRDAAFFGAAWSEWAARLVRRLARQTRLRASRIAFVAVHGQTVVHLPSPRMFLGEKVGVTIQLADLSRLAVRTGIKAIGNFRTADLAAGGSGAPLAPYAHRLVFGRLALNVAVQNMGGIGNVTLLNKGKVESAFDTGPGNVWIDTLFHWRSGGRTRFDRNGATARSGRPDPHLLSQLLQHPYFQKRPPKSAGWEEFGPMFLGRFRSRLNRLSLRDAAATVTHATAIATRLAYERFVFPRLRPKLLIFCGGGARNLFLTELIARNLSGVKAVTSDTFGYPAEEVEAISFALLGAETLRGHANNEPRATGAKSRVVCGLVAPATGGSIA